MPILKVIAVVFIAYILYTVISEIIAWILLRYFPTEFHKLAQHFISSHVRYNSALTSLKVRGGTHIYTSNRYPCELCFEVMDISVEEERVYHLHIDGILRKGEGYAFAEYLSEYGVGEGKIFVVSAQNADLIHACLDVKYYRKKIELPWEKLGNGGKRKRIRLPWALPVLRPSFQPAHQPL